LNAEEVKDSSINQASGYFLLQKKERKTERKKERKKQITSSCGSDDTRSILKGVFENNFLMEKSYFES
jgi:hypothetical protein